jgi:hypothetical protein
LLARHLDVRIQAKGTATLSSSVQQLLGHRLLAYLEGEDGAYSWNASSQRGTSFDDFARSHPPPPKQSFASNGINTTSLRALADIRNAVAHHAGDLRKLRRATGADVVAEVAGLNIPGVVLSGSVVTLAEPFLEFARVAGLAVRNYHGEF